MMACLLTAKMTMVMKDSMETEKKVDKGMTWRVTEDLMEDKRKTKMLTSTSTIPMILDTYPLIMYSKDYLIVDL